MKITAAICTYNREKYLPQVLNSIACQTLAADQYEIIVVDNNSPGNTQEIVEQFQRNNPSISCSYFLETKQGLSFARNKAIEEAKFEIITFVDDDAFLKEDYFAILVAQFKADTQIAAIGGKILLHFETIVPNWENKYLNSLLGYYNPSENEFTYARNGKNSDYPRGSNMTIHQKVFDKIGMFNVELGRVGGNLLGGEEKDIFYRIYNEPGFKVNYIPNAIVYHCVPIERTTKAFIIRQAIGTGHSERIRAQKEKTYLTSLAKEIYKSLGSIVLFFLYLIHNQFTKGKMILIFRIHVFKGLLNISKLN